MTRKTFKFHRVYTLVSVVEECLNYSSRSLIEIGWDAPNIVAKLSKPTKLTLLHEYIYAMIAVSQRDDYHHNDDLYDDDETLVKPLEDDLQIYGISFEPVQKFKQRLDYGDADDERPFRDWFDVYEESFEQLWEKSTDEVFHLLFANRMFLLKFNRTLAMYLEEGNVTLPPNVLDDKGKIKRVAMPSWVKKAVYCRDHGRCVMCQKDLTGLLSTDRHVHYDHMVPLNMWGTNDPCNIQLMCEACNLKKSGGIIATGYLYPAWWDD